MERRSTSNGAPIHNWVREETGGVDPAVRFEVESRSLSLVEEAETTRDLGVVAKDSFGWSKDFLAADGELGRDGPRAVVRCNRSVNCWMPPDIGGYKSNCDAMVDRSGNWVGVGIVIRGPTGEVFAYCSQIMEANFNIKVAKLVSIQKCIQFGIDCGLSPCVVESNEASVVKWISDGERKNSEYGIILADISSTIYKLNGVTFSHVQKKGSTKWPKRLQSMRWEFLKMLSGWKIILGALVRWLRLISLARCPLS
ncbi:hypothetical protein LWI29_008684 [Acer saccharum]|uniref:RNase H type-1 domain-containing protein n=1 Tax=Acer saccharum TaxID=4024 RepID=A0AA39RYY0_ACESA|nr:hypothetical protein LWI29_008684 [Acer saccharum]